MPIKAAWQDASAEAMSIASTSLQQRQSISLSSFFYCWISEEVVPSGSVKKVFLKNPQNPQVLPLAQLLRANFIKF